MSNNQQWTIVNDSVSFWEVEFKGEELARYYTFMEFLREEAIRHIPIMYQCLASFFSIPDDYIRDTIPAIYIEDSVAGGTAKHLPASNTIRIQTQYALPFFLGEAKDLRQTHFFSVLAHELGHAIRLAVLTAGNTDRYFKTYMRLDKKHDEFFARICQRVITTEMQIILNQTAFEEFREDDPHRTFVYADQHFEAITMLPPQERYEMAINPQKITKYIQ